MRRKTFLGLAALLAALLAACSGAGPDPAEAPGLRVLTTLFPLYDFSRAIGGDKARVELLLPPGVEAHGFEPRPGDMKRIARADVFAFTGFAMEPWAERIVAGIDKDRTAVVDASRGMPVKRNGEGGHAHDHDIPHADSDPHIWLDFANAQAMVDTLAAAMAKKDPAHAAFYRANADALKTRLAALDRRYAETLRTCKVRTLIHAGHFAFGYLTDRYGLTYVAAYPGFSPNAEPSPKRLATVVQKVRTTGVRAIYVEELLEPRVAQSISRETGVPILLLHGAHNIAKDDLARGATFLSLMEANLDNLKKGLACPN